ncbi:MAG TPA: hypothetical protein VHU14_09895 [Solirubrobacterales bacterium]|jgi:hypothetical protein|nr:hypothetical protein [Solirubrobacterales bacterium]
MRFERAAEDAICHPRLGRALPTMLLDAGLAEVEVGRRRSLSATSTRSTLLPTCLRSRLRLPRAVRLVRPNSRIWLPNSNAMPQEEDLLGAMTLVTAWGIVA